MEFLQVLSNAEYQEIVAPKPPTPTVRALALFDYQGQTQRELSFNKVRHNSNPLIEDTPLTRPSGHFVLILFVLNINKV